MAFIWVFAKRYGAYAVTHDNTDKAIKTLKAAEKILITDGDSMILSPEGQRTPLESWENSKRVYFILQKYKCCINCSSWINWSYRANVRNSWIVNPGRLQQHLENQLLQKFIKIFQLKS